MAGSDSEKLVCCFCGETVVYPEALVLSISAPANVDEFQNMFAHRKCLKKHITKNMPLHPDFEPK
jgi:hypothetical protein